MLKVLFWLLVNMFVAVGAYAQSFSGNRGLYGSLGASSSSFYNLEFEIDNTETESFAYKNSVEITTYRNTVTASSPFQSVNFAFDIGYEWDKFGLLFSRTYSTHKATGRNLATKMETNSFLGSVYYKFLRNSVAVPYFGLGGGVSVSNMELYINNIDVFKGYNADKRVTNAFVSSSVGFTYNIKERLALVFDYTTMVPITEYKIKKTEIDSNFFSSSTINNNLTINFPIISVVSFKLRYYNK